MGNEHARQATTTTSAAATTSAAVDVTNVDGGVPRSRDEEIQLARRRAKHNEKMEANFLERIGTNSAACDPHGLIRAAVKGNTHKLRAILSSLLSHHHHQHQQQQQQQHASSSSSTSSSSTSHTGVNTTTDSKDDVAASTNKTTHNNTPQSWWGMWNQERDINVVHMCAALGHLEEMDMVLDYWSAIMVSQYMSAVAAGGGGGGALSASSQGSSDPVEAAKGLVNSITRNTLEFTPLMYAIYEGHYGVVECLMNKWRADPALLCGNELFKRFTALHLCAKFNRPECAEVVLAASTEYTRLVMIKTDYKKAKTGTPLEVALGSGNLRVARVFTDTKWGTQLMRAMEKRDPIRKYWTRTRNLKTLPFLCQTFTRGLEDAFVHEHSRYWPIIMQNPGFTRVINYVSLRVPRLTPLFAATMQGEEETAIKLLSMGADPNISCKVPSSWRKENDLPKTTLTPMVIAVVRNSKNLVCAMRKQSGVLPADFIQLWSEPDFIFDIEAFLDGSWENHSGMRQEYKAALPHTRVHRKMYISKFLLDSDLTQGIQIDTNITSLMIRYQAAITGVLELVNIQALGRLQQTSQFWYHAASINSLWKFALMNTSRTWPEFARNKLSLCIDLLDKHSSTQWKHVGFFWLARNRCHYCRVRYRHCDDKNASDTHCNGWTSSRHHHPESHIPQLKAIRSAYNSSLLET